MEPIDVKIVELPAMRVASLARYGASPEHMAWSALLEWAKSHGVMASNPQVRFFGFNNPNPSPGSPNYGYEVWITVGDEVETDETVQVIQAPGGLYAVTRVVGVENIFDVWQQLVAWVETSPYQFAQGTCLEENIKFMEDVPDHELVLDLYLPIK